MPPAHHLAVRSYAFKGRCFVASAATFLLIDAIPDALRPAFIIGTGSEDDLAGGSGIVGPDGEYRVGPVLGGETVVGTVDLAEAIAFKHDLDVTGHYNQRDVFQWSVDRRREFGRVVHAIHSTSCLICVTRKSSAPWAARPFAMLW